MCFDPGSKGVAADETHTTSANTSSSHQESHDVGMYTVCSPRIWVAPVFQFFFHERHRRAACQFIKREKEVQGEGKTAPLRSTTCTQHQLETTNKLAPYLEENTTKVAAAYQPEPKGLGRATYLCSKITLCFCAHESEINILDIWVSKFVMCIYKLWMIVVRNVFPFMIGASCQA